MTKKGKKQGGMFRLVKFACYLTIIVVIGFIGFYLVYPDVSVLKKLNPKKTSFM